MSPVERSSGGGGSFTSPLTTKGDIYGHSTVDARIPVGTDGQVLTAASGQALGVQWQSSFTLLFSSVLGSAAASIDTGTNGIASGYNSLHFLFYGRSSGAFTSDAIGIQFNGDTGANYDSLITRNVGGAIGSASRFGGTNALIGNMPGASDTAGYFTATRASLPLYGVVTGGFKVGESTSGYVLDAIGNAQTQFVQWAWRSTAAINRMKVFSDAGANLVTGSALLIYGTP